LQELQQQQSKFASQSRPNVIINTDQPQSIEERIASAKSQLQQKQYQLAEAEAKLETVESDHQLNKLPAVIGSQLRPKLVPFVSFLIGIDLCIFLNIEVIYHPRSQLLLWRALTENLFFIIGANLLSVTLSLGIIGYYIKIDSQKLRTFRMIIAAISMTAVILSLIQYYTNQ
jgi:hypothetical protein